MNFRLYASPLTKGKDNFMRENHILLFFIKLKKLEFNELRINNA
jgi:hypothetical protein